MGAILCDNCKYDIENSYFEGCALCGGPSARHGVCERCSDPCSQAWCVGERSGELRQIIDSYKFYNNYAAHGTLAELLSQRIGHLPAAVTVVPIPTVASHIRQRGYDHTLLIARSLAKRQGITLTRPLHRQTTTKQRDANRAQRFAQAKEAFITRGKIDQNATYLLIDDVITTGATLHYAALALKQAGASEVWAAAIARQPLD